MTTGEDIPIKDHRKKRRWAFIWGFGIAALIAILIGVIAQFGKGEFGIKRDHIARIRIEGPIFTDKMRDEMFEELEESESVKALIVEIDSPGGGAHASFRIYQAIKAMREKIPTIAVMENVAASGGYMSAIGAERIFASPLTITGSIGVIFETIDFADAMDELGIGNTVIRSSDVKGGISPYRKPSPAEIASAERVLDDLHESFSEIVGRERTLGGNALALVTNGDVFTGEKALELGLIDALGGEKEALEYLRSRDEELADLDIEDWEPLPDEDESFFERLMASGSRVFLRELGVEPLQQGVPAFLWR